MEHSIWDICPFMAKQNRIFFFGAGNILVIMLKNFWKNLDFLLLFVRYSFIMISNGDYREESALWVN